LKTGRPRGRETFWIYETEEFAGYRFPCVGNI